MALRVFNRIGSGYVEKKITVRLAFLGQMMKSTTANILVPLSSILVNCSWQKFILWSRLRPCMLLCRQQQRPSSRIYSKNSSLVDSSSRFKDLSMSSISCACVECVLCVRMANELDALTKLSPASSHTLLIFMPLAANSTKLFLINFIKRSS